MGRKRKYNTDEERLKARQASQMNYYWRNAVSIRKINLKRYHEKMLKVPDDKTP